MKRIFWHLLRAAAMFLTLAHICYRCDTFRYGHSLADIPIRLATVLLLSGLYDIVLACLPRITDGARVRIAAVAAVAVVVLIVLEPHPWDDLDGYFPLCLYLPELVLSLRDPAHKLIAIPVIAMLAALAPLFSLYRIGWATSCPHATIKGGAVPCRVIKVLGTSDAIVATRADLDWRWHLVDVQAGTVEMVSHQRSMGVGALQFVDVRSRSGLAITKRSYKTGWDPKLSYSNGTLSFCVEPNKLLVCKAVKL